jgi:hypothetical protein
MHRWPVSPGCCCQCTLPLQQCLDHRLAPARAQPIVLADCALPLDSLVYLRCWGKRDAPHLADRHFPKLTRTRIAKANAITQELFNAVHPPVPDDRLTGSQVKPKC